MYRQVTKGLASCSFSNMGCIPTGRAVVALSEYKIGTVCREQHVERFGSLTFPRF